VVFHVYGQDCVNAHASALGIQNKDLAKLFTVPGSWWDWQKPQFIITKRVDGDTVHVIIDLGFGLRYTTILRLFGINTPERGVQGWDKANAYLDAVIPKVTTIKTLKADKYGRFLAMLYVDTLNVNDDLVNQGLAVVYMADRAALGK
jgi:endonuclease YncB( thermonuclease family)